VGDRDMRASRKLPFSLRLSFEIWQGGLEAQQVIGLRLSKLARGGRTASAEMNRMVSEKLDAAFEAQRATAKAALTGNAAQIPSRVVALYRRKMRSNRQRLITPKPRMRSHPRRSKKGWPL
jgi:hypothetical protein